MSEAHNDVFISYGRDPGVTQFANQLRKDLETSGVSVWMDTEDIPIGTDWRAAITTGVDNCRWEPFELAIKQL